MKSRLKTEPRSPQPLIAVVDDDESFLRSVGRLLRSMGYAVRTFGTGKEFLDAWPAESPDCLILDVQMPEMGGPELHRALLAQGSRLPVVFVTGLVTPQALQHVRSQGSGLIIKPFDKKSLLQAIVQALGNNWDRSECKFA